MIVVPAYTGGNTSPIRANWVGGKIVQVGQGRAPSYGFADKTVMRNCFCPLGVNRFCSLLDSEPNVRNSSAGDLPFSD
jgi:hypothetical protein